MSSMVDSVRKGVIIMSNGEHADSRVDTQCIMKTMGNTISENENECCYDMKRSLRIVATKETT